MKVVYTEEALRNLDEILGFIASNYPSILGSFERRLQAVVARIGDWPKSAQRVAERPDVRAVPLIRYPYKIFYRVTTTSVEILYIHHAARQPPWNGDR